MSLLLANLGQEAVLGRRANISTCKQSQSPKGSLGHSYYLSFLLGLQLLVELTQAGGSVVMGIGHQQGRADARSCWGREAAPMTMAMCVGVGRVRSHLARSRYGGVVDL